MSAGAISTLLPFGFFIVLVFIIGIYCLLASYNLIRVLLGLELLIKGATLLIGIVGFVTGRVVYTQTLIITLIVVEVVIIAVGVGLVLGLHGYNKTLDLRRARNLKG